MNDALFSIGDSCIHRLNPRAKISIAVVFSFITAFSNQLTALMLSMICALTLLYLAKLSPAAVLRRLFLVSGMVLICWLVLPFTMKSGVLFRVGPISVHQPGIDLALRISLKSFSIVLVVIALVATASAATVGSVLEWMHIPRKLVLLFMLTYRYLFVLEQEYQRLITAARIRGFQPKNNLHTYKTYAYLIGMLFVRASLKGEHVYKAMLCRGFKGNFYSIQEFAVTRQDRAFLSAAGLLLSAIGYLEWGKTITSCLS